MVRFAEGWSREKIDELVEVSADLGQQEGVCDVRVGGSREEPSELFGEEHAAKALDEARMVVRLVEKLFRRSSS